MTEPLYCSKCSRLPRICRVDREQPADNFVLWNAQCDCGVTLYSQTREGVVVLWNLFRHTGAASEAKTVAKLLRAMAGGSNAKDNGHDIILNKAADLLDDYDGRAA